MPNLTINKVKSNIYTTAQNKTQKNAEVEQNNQNKAKLTNKSNTLKTVALPISVMAGGGLLIYYGVKSPNKVQVFKNIYNKNLQGMRGIFEEVVSDIQTVTNKISRLNKYSALRHLARRDFPLVEQNRKLNNVTSASEALEILEDSFTKLLVPLQCGASDMDRLSLKYEKLKREQLNKFEAEKWQKKLRLNDYTFLPKFENGKHKEAVTTATQNLRTLEGEILAKIDRVQSSSLELLDEGNYKILADSVYQTRLRNTKAKKTILATAFEKIKQLLNLSEDFKPEFSTVPTLKNFKALSKEDLQLTQVPQTVNQKLNGNYYISIIRTTDFSKIKAKQLEEIYHRMSPESDIQDLKFLIDRLRLAREVERTTTPDNVRLYDITIAKLEFLANKLNEICEREILSKAEKIDFEGLTAEQKRGRLSQFNYDSQKLGFNSIQVMDEYFANKFEKFKETSFHKHIEEFISDPKHYFM